MGGRATQVAERLLQLAGKNPDEYSSGLDEFNAKDVAVGQASFGVGGGGGGSQPFLTATVPITNAEIIALGGGGGSGVYFDVVAAPGPGKYLRFESAEVKIDASATAYGNIDATAFMDFETHGATGVSVSPQMDDANLTGLFGGDGEAAVASFSVLAPSGGVSYLDASQVEDMPLALFVFNATVGVFTGGDELNSGSITVWYTIETLP